MPSNNDEWLDDYFRRNKVKRKSKKVRPVTVQTRTTRAVAGGTNVSDVATAVATVLDRLGYGKKKQVMSRLRFTFYVLIAALFWIFVFPIIQPRVAPIFASLRNAPVVVSVLGAPAGGGTCVDIADSVAAGWDPNETIQVLPRNGEPEEERPVFYRVGKGLIPYNSRFDSTGAPAWNGNPGGRHTGSDVVGKAGTPVQLPIAMTLVQKGRYTDGGRYGDFRRFEARGLSFYFGHLEKGIDVPEGTQLSAGTQIGVMSGGPDKSWGPHTHWQIEKANSVDGFGDVDPEVWWKQNCSQVAAVASGGANMPITGKSTISAARIDEVLKYNNSPMQGVGTFMLAEAKKRNINAAVWLGFFRAESTYGKNGAAVSTKSSGNIECAGYKTCNGRWRSYSSWEDGAVDWLRLIEEEYIKGRNLTGLRDIVLVYAPPLENDSEGYAQQVAVMVKCWADESVPVDQCEGR